MKYQEFGDDHKQTILLLHGGGLSWWNYREVAARLKTDYHIILPILDGHAGSDRPFTTIEENAAEIISFIEGHCGRSVLLIGGLSLGGQILLEMLSERNDLCPYALIESAAVLPSKLTNALIAPAFNGSYGLIKHKSFAKLQFKSLHMDQAFFEDYYHDTCQITKDDMIAFMKASTSYALKDSFRHALSEVHVFYGEKETKGIRMSAEAICRMRPACSLHPIRGCYHGEFSINHPDQYAAAIQNILRA